MRERTYRIAEIFGPTIQGEGPFSGSNVHFVRLGGCDYRCSWCDSMHAVEPELVKELPIMSSTQIADALGKLPGPHKRVVFSGGNPLLWDLEECVVRLKRRGWKIHVETQGTIFRPWLKHCEWVIVSPKPHSAGKATSLAVAEKFKNNFETVSHTRGIGMNPNMAYKFVIFNERDYAYAVQMTTALQLRQVWFSTGTGLNEPAEAILERTRQIADWMKVDYALEKVDVRLSPQMHVLYWGHKLGV